jgi:hypothetical protein
MSSSLNLFVRISELELAYDRLARRLDALQAGKPADRRPATPPLGQNGGTAEMAKPELPRRGRGRPPGAKNRPKGNDLIADEKRV